MTDSFIYINEFKPDKTTPQWDIDHWNRLKYNLKISSARFPSSANSI